MTVANDFSIIRSVSSSCCASAWATNTYRFRRTYQEVRVIIYTYFHFRLPEPALLGSRRESFDSFPTCCELVRLELRLCSMYSAKFPKRMTYIIRYIVTQQSLLQSPIILDSTYRAGLSS